MSADDIETLKAQLAEAQAKNADLVNSYDDYRAASASGLADEEAFDAAKYAYSRVTGKKEPFAAWLAAVVKSPSTAPKVLAPWLAAAAAAAPARKSAVFAPKGKASGRPNTTPKPSPRAAAPAARPAPAQSTPRFRPAAPASKVPSTSDLRVQIAEATKQAQKDGTPASWDKVKALNAKFFASR